MISGLSGVQRFLMIWAVLWTIHEHVSECRVGVWDRCGLNGLTAHDTNNGFQSNRSSSEAGMYHSS